MIRCLKTAARTARTGTTAATTAKATHEMTVMVMASGPAVIFARAAGTDTPGTTTVRVQQSRGAVVAAYADSPHARARRRVMAVRVGVTGIVDGIAPMAEVAVATTEGTTTATHAMSAVTTLGVTVRVLAHGIVSDTIMAWRDRSAMSPRTPAGAEALATGDRVRRESASSSTSRLPKARRRTNSAP